jgi:hypothetical protein
MWITRMWFRARLIHYEVLLRVQAIDVNTLFLKGFVVMNDGLFALFCAINNMTAIEVHSALDL